jgi:hypothetical protein
MHHIQFLRLVRDVAREAKHRGYYGDVLADQDRVPLIGSRNQQMAIATLACDCTPQPATHRERELVRRLARAAVLTSPVDEPRPPLRPVLPARRRAW